jgi:hypothetical protein
MQTYAIKWCVRKPGIPKDQVQWHTGLVLGSVNNLTFIPHSAQRAETIAAYWNKNTTYGVHKVVEKPLDTTAIAELQTVHPTFKFIRGRLGPITCNGKEQD